MGAAVKMKQTLLAGLLLVASSLPFSTAQAALILPGSAISLTGAVAPGGGGDVSTATSLDFLTNTLASGPSDGTILSYFGGTGTFSGMFCFIGSCGSIKDLTSLAVGPDAIANFVVLSGGGAPQLGPIVFSLSSITSIDRSKPGFLGFVGSGSLSYVGFDPTPATFSFSTQGNLVTSFSATTTANRLPPPVQGVPEASTWAMIMAGFLGLGLLSYRRRSSTHLRLA